MWFEKLMGFKEENPAQVRNNIELVDEYLTSKITGKKFKYGSLEVPTLGELINSSSNPHDYKSKLSIYEVVGDVQDFHVGYENAMFQAASQFNLLEMVSPNITPELGIDRYGSDLTQGPACAIACGAGTIYRNYFGDVNGQIGQTSTNQIDCLSEIGDYFNNKENKLWEMRNGYAMLSSSGLDAISEILNQQTGEEYVELRNKLRIGLQLNSEVTIKYGGHLVSQAYCSALPIGYSQIPVQQWEAFSRLILSATYEATFYAALSNFEQTGNDKLFLTLVGGGVFGNPQEWIFDAIEESVLKFRKTPLVVLVVSYGNSNPALKSFLKNLNDKIGTASV